MRVLTYRETLDALAKGDRLFPNGSGRAEFASGDRVPSRIVSLLLERRVLRYPEVDPRNPDAPFILLVPLP